MLFRYDDWMVELLAPAGNPEALEAAIAEGADAVYLGLKSFNARMRSSNFAWNQFEATVDVLHKRNKKIYVTVNTVVTENEMERLYRFLAYLNNVGPDGIIVQDLGLIQMAHKHFPNLKLHASTQLNIASAKAANAMSRWGVSRTVLARELSLEEIRAVHANTSCELEVFVHGALCVSESGLCLFSSYLGGKSANRGMCTQACRRLYTAHEPEGDREGYFFSPADLQLIEYIPDLIQAGVASFKIEGRMKSAEYVGTVVSAYRYVIDNWEADKKAAVETGKRILANDFARKKTGYRFKSTRAEEVLNPDQAGGTGIYLGIIDGIKKGAVEEVPFKDGTRAVHYVQLKDGHYTPEKGDSVRIHKKDDSGRESWKIQDIMESKSGAWLQLPADSGKGDSVYLLQTKAMTKRYPRLLPASLEKYRKQQNLAFKLADMLTKIEAARLLIYKAAEKKENHEDYGLDSAMAKMYASDIALEVVNNALQIHGGSGFIKGIPVEKMYRDAKITTIYEGTNEIQRLVIASKILGKLGKENR